MIARYVDDAHSVIDLLQNFADHAALRLGPIPAPAELPAIDDVAHEKQRVARILCQEVGQQFRLATARAQMDIGDEDGAVAAFRRRAGMGNAKWRFRALAALRSERPGAQVGIGRPSCLGHRRAP